MSKLIFINIFYNGVEFREQCDIEDETVSIKKLHELFDRSAKRILNKIIETNSEGDGDDNKK
jgi:hypothetical protein